MYKAKVFLVKVLKHTKLLKHLNFCLIKVVNGVSIKIPFINGIGIVNLLLESDWLDAIILRFTKNDNFTFVDVGVNIGQTILRVKTLRPKIKFIGFEPNSSCVAYTQQLIRSNNFNNCFIQNCALSSSTGQLILEKTFVDDPRASVISTLRPDFFKDKEYILALEYDSLYLDQPIDIVKIDTEGSELEVITGMKQSIIKHKPLIACEVLDSHHTSVLDFTQERATALSELLLSMQYSIIRLKTSSVENRIVSFEKIDTITIQQWTEKSYELNDYLFYPTTNEGDVIENLSGICG